MKVTSEKEIEKLYEHILIRQEEYCKNRNIEYSIVEKELYISLKTNINHIVSLKMIKRAIIHGK